MVKENVSYNDLKVAEVYFTEKMLFIFFAFKDPTAVSDWIILYIYTVLQY